MTAPRGRIACALLATALAGCTTSPGSPGVATAATSARVGLWIDDSWITTQVKTRMIADASVSGTTITVETVRGVVHLGGFAASRAEIDQAVRLARGVDGVKGVKNDIRLRASAK